MFEFTKMTDHSGYLTRTATATTDPVDVTIYLENGVSSDDFVLELEDMECENVKLITIDPEDFYAILSEVEEAHFGRIHFSKTGKYYFTADDLSWLRKLKPKNVFLSFEGDIMIQDVANIASLLGAILPKHTTIIFSYQEQGISLIKINVLAV